MVKVEEMQKLNKEEKKKVRENSRFIELKKCENGYNKYIYIYIYIAVYDPNKLLTELRSSAAST